MPRCLDCGVSIKQGYTYCYEHHRRHVQLEKKNRDSDARTSEGMGIFGAFLIGGIIDIFKDFFSLFNRPPSWINHKIPKWHIRQKPLWFLIRLVVSFFLATILAPIIGIILNNIVLSVILVFPLWIIMWKISGWIFTKN